MATATQAPEAATTDEALLSARRHRITVEEYHRMAEAGIYGAESRIELVEGVLVAKMTRHPPHIIATDLLSALLHRAVPDGFFVSMGNPVTIPDRDSEPEPDAMVLKGHPRDYLGRRRGPADAVLVVEVADSSYRFDRETKWRTYGAAGVAVYWLLDLNRRRLEVFSEPTGPSPTPGFGKVATLGADDAVTLVLDGREVARFAVREILP